MQHYPVAIWKFGQHLVNNGKNIPPFAWLAGRSAQMLTKPLTKAIIKFINIGEYSLFLLCLQSDHMNGLRFIADAFGPKEFWWNGDKVKTASFEELMDILKTKGVKKLLPADLTAGKRIHGVKIQVLHPKPDSYSSDRYEARARLNNNSLVLKISFRGTTFLFPGDLQKQGEAVLISNASDALKSDVLLSPHHGSKTSNSPEFLKAVSPSICVISSGGENLPRSSQEQTIRRLTELGCKVFFTGRTGAVQITVGVDKLEVDTFLKDEKPELLGALTSFSGIA